MMKQSTHVVKNLDLKSWSVSILTWAGWYFPVRIFLFLATLTAWRETAKTFGEGEKDTIGEHHLARPTLFTVSPFPSLRSLVPGYLICDQAKKKNRLISGYRLSSPIPIPLRLRFSFSAHKLWHGVFVKPLFFLRLRSPKSGTQSIGLYKRWHTNWHKLFSDL